MLSRAKSDRNCLFAFLEWSLPASEAVKLIVDAYVHLKDREAIEALREHRQMLRERLQRSNSDWFNTGSSIRLIDSDLSEIEAGLPKFQ